MKSLAAWVNQHLCTDMYTVAADLRPAGVTYACCVTHGTFALWTHVFLPESRHCLLHQIVIRVVKVQLYYGLQLSMLLHSILKYDLLAFPPKHVAAYESKLQGSIFGYSRKSSSLHISSWMKAKVVCLLWNTKTSCAEQHLWHRLCFAHSLHWWLFMMQVKGAGAVSWSRYSTCGRWWFLFMPLKMLKKNY